MRILIVSNSYSPEPTGIGPVTGELAEGMAAAGHDVHVIAAKPSYPDWKLAPGFSAFTWSNVNEGGVQVHRCPIYIPQPVRGITRMVHYTSFAASAFFPAAKLAVTFRPHLVFMVAPTLLAAPLALLTAKLSSAVSWLHVQDFEVEAGFATGELNNHGAIAKAATLYERAILRRFQQVSSISPEMCKKLHEKGCDPDRIYELRNWTNIADLAPGTPSKYHDEFGINARHVLLYSGALGNKQGIETILDAADLLSERNDIQFLICGAGPSKVGLEARAEKMPNVQVRDLQPKARLAELLSTATVHLLPQRQDAADLVLPSKLANMLASGRPVIAGAKPGTGLAREVEGAGLACEPDSGSAMASAILKLIDNAELREQYGKVARERAAERWMKKNILAAFEQRIWQCVNAKDKLV